MRNPGIRVLGLARGAGLAPGVVLALALVLGAAATGARALELALGNDAEGLVEPERLIGEYVAVLQADGFPQPVRLTIHRVEPGRTAGKLVFASPRRCFVDLEYGGPHEGRHLFYIIRFTNCFEYEDTDFVALWPALAETEPAGGGDGPPGPDEPAEAVRAPAGRLHSIRFAISLGGVERETAVLVRE